ncbi:MAG: hypothetical protein Fur0021_16770 [Candidatus Promineifilaceae bacterium]
MRIPGISVRRFLHLVVSLALMSNAILPAFAWSLPPVPPPASTASSPLIPTTATVDAPVQGPPAPGVPAFAAPAFAAPVAASGWLTKTVGLNAHLCASSDDLTVVSGAAVTYCYQLQNTGSVTLTQHDLADSALGPILTDWPLLLPPGGTAVFTQTAVLTQTTVNTATWTAAASLTDTFMISDVATVTTFLPAQLNLTASSNGPTFLGQPTDLTASLNELFVETFENGFDDWTMTGLWNLENEADTCGGLRAPFPSPSNVAYYGLDTLCTFDNGAANGGALTLVTAIDLPPVAPVTLSFWSYEQTECAGDCSYDNRYIELSTDGGINWNLLGEGDTEGVWYERIFDLSAYVGSQALIRFRFDSVDDVDNYYVGWMIDNIRLTTVLDEDNFNYSWDFGDNTTGSGAQTSHTYPAVGVYTAVVTASNALNLLTATTSVDVYQSIISVTPSTISETVPAGALQTVPLTIENSGPSPLIWTIQGSVNPPAGPQTYRTLSVAAAGAPPAPGHTAAGNSGRSAARQAAGPPAARPADLATLSSPAGVSALPPDVLLLAADDDIYEGSPLQNFLNAYGDLGAVDLYDAAAGTPSLVALQNYDVVITWSNNYYADPVALGDVLADYVDAGGGVIIASFALGTDGLELQGRFMAENYTAVNGGAGAYAPACLGSYDSGHAIFAGVTAVCDEYRLAGSYLTADATALAFWDDGEIFVGVKDNLPVVTITAYPGVYYAWTGQMPDVIHNSIHYLTSTWLSVAPQSGVTAPFSSTQVTVTLDAAGLISDTYAGELIIASNDALTPLLPIPVTLHVLGGPLQAISPSLLDFGAAYVGYPNSLELLVSNNGTANLNVAQILAADPAVTVTPTTFTVAPAAAQVVTVTFTPVVAGSLVTTLTVSSNDPLYPIQTVPVVGMALTPPLMHVDPLTIEETLASGDNQTVTLTISNTGATDLNWALTLDAADNPPANPQATFDFARQQPAKGVNNDNQIPLRRAAGIFPLAPGDFTLRAASPVPLTSLAVDPTTGFIYAQANGGTAFYRYDPFTNVWSALTSAPISSGNNGGAVYLAGKIYTVYTNNSSQMGVYDIAGNVWTLTSNGLGDGTGNITSDGNRYLYLVVGDIFRRFDIQTGIWSDLAAPPIFFESWGGLSYLNGFIYGQQGNGYTGFARYDVAADAWEALPDLPDGAVLGGAIDPAGLVYYAYGNYGGSNWYAFDLQTESWSVTAIPFFTVEDGGLVHVGQNGVSGIYFAQGEEGVGFARLETLPYVDWVSVDPLVGVTPPQTASQITVTLDAAGLFGGVYAAALDVASNDPAAPLATVPITLHVTADPLPQVSPSQLEFADVFEGYTATLPLLVENRGLGDLIISDVAASDPTLTAAPASFVVPPLDSQTVMVTFSPVISGTLLGVLTLTTNSVITPVMTVPVIAQAIGLPAAVVTPTAIAETIGAGASRVVTLTVSNPGESDLIWDLSATGVISGSAGSDYILRTSNDVGGPAFNWIDIAGTGTLVTGLSDDNYVGPFPIGFDFTYYGQTYTQFYIGSNGFIGFGPPNNYDSLSNTTIPNVNDPDSIIAWLWDDLLPRSGVVHYQNIDGQLVIQFTNYSWYSSSATVTAEIILRPSGSILLQYLAFSPGAPLTSSSVGIENQDGMVGIQAAYNQAFLQPNLALSFAALPNWLDLNPMNGSTPAGGSTPVEVTLDTTNLISGTYQAEIHLLSNDPVTPEVTVPVTMVVVADPIAVVTPLLLDFGVVFAGYTATLPLLVENAGATDLSVMAIAADHPDLSAVPDAFVLPPFTAQTVDVTFAPMAAGEITATLTITTDDPATPVQYVTVLAQAVAPPVVVVDPTQIEDSLYVGYTRTLTLTISNLGGSDLVWELLAAETTPEQPDVPTQPADANAAWVFSDEPAAGVASPPLVDMAAGRPTPAAPDTPRVLLLTQGGTPATAETALVATGLFTVDDIDILDSPPSLSLSQLLPYDAVLVWTNSAFSNPVTVGNVLRDYVDAGGGVVIGTYAYSNSWAMQGGILNPDYSPFLPASQQSVSGVLDMASITKPNHRIFEGIAVAPTYWSNSNYSDPSLNVGGVLLAQDTAGNNLVAENSTGKVVGIVIYPGNLNSGNAEAKRLFANALYSAYRPSDWLSVAPDAGIVPALSTQTITVTLDATNLISGTYLADLLLSSNDPATPQVTIPVTLHVSGDANAGLIPTVLDFGTVFAGYTHTLQLQIDNTGADTLLVYDIAASDPALSVSPAAFSVPVFASQIVDVTFAPTTYGALFATLFISTNVPLTPTFAVPVTGLAQLPPIIEVSPPAVELTLDAGAIQDLPFLISNTVSVTGGMPLTWTISALFDTGGGVADIGVVGANAAAMHALLLADSFLASQYTFTNLGNNWTFAALDPYDLIVVDESDAGLTVTEAQALRDFFETGRSVILGMDDADTLNVTARDHVYATFGVTNAQDGAFHFAAVSSHPVADGITTISEFTDSDNDYYTANGAEWVVRGTDGRDYVMAYNGVGRSVILSERLNAWYNASPQLIRNAITWAGISWLSIEPRSGATLPQTAASLTLTLDATHLISQTYTAELTISSNDPLQPQVIVPVTLHVLGEPAAAVTPALLDFGAVFVGYTHTLPLLLQNDGTDTLIVQDINSSNPLLTVTPVAFQVPAQQTQAVTVMVSPVVTGTLSAVLTITTNAPLTPVLTVTALAESVYPPVISATPASFAVTQDTGMVMTRTLTVTNAALGTLDFAVDAANNIVGLDPDTGLLVGPSAQTLTVTFDTTTLGAGVYYDTINITSNDPETPLIAVPVTFIVILVPPEVPAAPSPQDGEINVRVDKTQTWQASPHAATYDIFLWEDGQPQPDMPTATGLTTPSYNYPGEFPTDTTYHWQVIARNTAGFTTGPVWTFTTETLPDVTVASVTAPPTTFSGQPAQFTWVVNNDGDRGTTAASWTDRVYISLQPDFDAGSATYLGQVTNPAYLGPGESYFNTGTFNLPQGISGDYYAFVLTDYGNAMRESDETNNTGRTPATFDVSLTPPPDLQVTALVGPPNTFSGSPIEITWVSSNEGSGGTVAASWHDRVYLSADPVLNTNQDTNLGTFSHSGALAAGESYTRSVTVNVPQAIYGDYYLFVTTDIYNNVYEFTSESNNTGGPSDPIAITLSPSPDLEVSSLSAPAAANSGATINVIWEVTNYGAGAPFETYWQDRVYLTSSPIFNANGATILGTFGHSGILQPGESYAQNRSLILPEGIAGTYYVHVWTDYAGQVFEFIGEDNNVGSSSPLLISLSPSPDLQVNAVTAPAAGTADTTIQVDWVIANDGDDAPGTLWKDKLYLSSLPTWSGSGVLLGAFDRPVALAAGAAYTQSRAVVLPATQPAGTYYVYVITDADNAIYEHNGENNNVGRSGAMLVAARPATDLSLGNLSAPAFASSGQPIAVGWTVTNTGAIDTLATSWTDAIYLSLDTNLNTNNDILLGSWMRSGALAAGEGYARAVSASLPNGISGFYYVFFLSDSGYQVNDNNRSNNTAYVTTPISVTLSLSPDLLPVPVNPPAEGQQGQPLAVAWTVSNVGAATANNNWYDAVYFSADPVQDPSDIQLLSRHHSGGLSAGSAYTESASVTIPTTAVGTNYLLIKTDNSGAVYEHDAESNNVTAWPITITVPPPADLVVITVTAPLSATPGEPITIDWTLQNQGEFTANGYLCDSVFVSADAAWDIGDAKIGTSCRNINLPPGASQAVQVQAVLPDAAILAALVGNLPGVTPGDYYAIVRADILNNIRESDDGNNAGVSTDTITVDVTPLTLGQPISDTLGTGELRFYRVEVDADQTLLITLDSSAASAANELYVRHGSVPSRGVFDYSFSAPLAADQSVLVPFTEAGVYYIMAYGASVPGGPQPYTLQAELEEFRLGGIDITEGGQGGPVTVQLTGAQFAPDTAISLENGTDVFPAAQTYFQDASTLYATFDLSGVPLGDYDVVIRHETTYPYVTGTVFSPVQIGDEMFLLPDDPSVITLTKSFEDRLPAAFSVVEPAGLPLQLERILPSALRPNQAFVFTIRYHNPSNNDIAAPILLAYGAPNVRMLAPGDSELAYGPKRLMALSESGPAGILRPGADAAIQLVVYAPSIPTTLLMDVDPIRETSEPFDFNDLLQNTGVVPTSPVWGDAVLELDSRLDGTWADYEKELSDYANRRWGYPNLSSNSDQLLLGLLAEIAYAQTFTPTTTTEGPTGTPDSFGGLPDYGYDPTIFAPLPGGVAACEGWRIALYRTQLRSVAYGFPPTASTLLHKYLDGPASNETFGTGHTLSQQAKGDPDYKSMHKQGESSAKSTIESQIKGGATSIPDFALSASLPNPKLDVTDDLKYSINGTQGTTAEVKNIQITEQPKDSCEDTSKTVSYKATIRYQIMDNYNFTAQDANKPGLLGYFGGLAYYLEQCGNTYPYQTFTILEEEISGEVQVDDPNNSGEDCDPPDDDDDDGDDVPVIVPRDPNDIIGPIGYGDANWISADSLLGYTIRFENDPELATAPAQMVYITQTLDLDLDARSFRLGAFGWGPYVFEVPPNRSFYTSRLDLVDDLGLYVDVNAGIDIVAGEAFWILQSIDPATGAPPINPLFGFLPPNVADGEGQGFVTYVVRPKNSVSTGSVIDALARIIFDANDPIDTPPIFNTIDAGSPTSVMTPLPPQTDQPEATLNWSSSDDAGGSGVAHVDVYVSLDGGPFALAQENVAGTTSVYALEPGHTYGFFTQAEDNTGNQEFLKTAAEATIQSLDAAITGLSAANDSPTTLGDATTLTATIAAGSNVSYTWEFGDGSSGSGPIASHSYPAVGIYTAIVTASNSVSLAMAATTITITDQAIMGLAVVNDSPTPLGQATALTATVTAGSSVEYIWDFGDGSGGSGSAASHVYPAIGSYTAVVTATNSINTAVISTTVTITDAPIVGLIAVNDGPTELGQITTLTATISAGSNVIYTWEFGDGNMGSGDVSSHVYPAVGVYTATVTASNGVGMSTATTVVTVTDVPIAGLTATNDSPTELGQATTLTATISTGSNVSYAWDFGDGSTGSGNISSHIYPAVGIYTATITASNDAGVSTATTLVTVTDVPIAGLTAANDSPTELGQVTMLTATISAGSNVLYAWDFGDGSAGSSSISSHVYPAVGVYTATVTASNGVGLSTATTVVTITDVPIAGLTAANDSPTELGQATTLTATIDAGSNVIYAWEFGDGNAGSSSVSSHVYPAVGVYTATVTASNGVGVSTATTVVTITDVPIVGLTVVNDSPTELGQATALTATISAGSNVIYAWEFGDGSTGSGSISSHIYPAVGVYTATVTASNGAGVSTATTLVTVTDAPIAGLTAANDSPTELGQATTLTATITAGSNVSYAWNFGDGNAGSGSMSSHIYPAVGVYTATVTASNGAGVSTATTIITITDIPVAGLTATNDGPTELGETTTLTATITAGSNVLYDWEFGDGSTGVGATVTHTYAAAGVYTATVTASNGAGAVVAATVVTIEYDVIFADGFESGDFSAWTAAITDSGDLTVTASAALAGSYGLATILDDTAPIYVRDNSPQAEASYRASFLFDPNGGVLPSSALHYIFAGIDAGNQAMIFALQLQQGDGAYRIRGQVRSDTGQVYTPWLALTDAPHTLELHWIAATAVAAEDGVFALWIDGVLLATLSDLDTDAYRVDQVRLGAIGGIRTGTSGILYFDEFVSRQ